MNQKNLLAPAEVISSTPTTQGYANKKAIVQWLLQTSEEIQFKLAPCLNRFNRPDDFIFSEANDAAARMMGCSLEQLIGHKLIKVLNIHPFHSFFQNYLRAYLYQTPLKQQVQIPLLTRKNKAILHEATAISGVLQVTIKVISLEVETPTPAPQEVAHIEKPQIPVIKEEVLDTIVDIPTSDSSEIVTEIHAPQEVAHNEKPQIPVMKEEVLDTVADAPKNDTPEIITKTPVLNQEPELATELPVNETVENPTAIIDPLVSQQISVDGKIEYINEQLRDKLELSEYAQQEVFIQDILHKVSQLPYHFALLRAKTKQVVQDLPLIFVTKSKQYLKVKGRIEPQTQGEQVTGLKLYYQVLQHTSDFHQVSAFGKVPASNSF